MNAEIPNDKYGRLKSEVEFMDIMCNLNPYHIPNIPYKNEKRVIYLSILKALYGFIQSAILWYDLYVSNLKEIGFVIKPYDLYVGNIFSMGSNV